MRFSKLIARARYALLLIPAFGLLTSIEVGCGVAEPDGVGNMDSDISTGHHPYGYGSYGYGSSGYGGYGSSGYGGYGGYGQ